LRRRGAVAGFARLRASVGPRFFENPAIGAALKRHRDADNLIKAVEEVSDEIWDAVVTDDVSHWFDDDEEGCDVIKLCRRHPDVASKADENSIRRALRFGRATAADAMFDGVEDAEARLAAQALVRGYGHGEPLPAWLVGALNGAGGDGERALRSLGGASR